VDVGAGTVKVQGIKGTARWSALVMFAGLRGAGQSIQDNNVRENIISRLILMANGISDRESASLCSNMRPCDSKSAAVCVDPVYYVPSVYGV